MNFFRRTPKSVAPEKSRDFGLIAWLENTKISLPLKGVECRFDVCGDIVNVDVDQIFYQTASKPLECLYSFPLPAGAAVYRCEMHVNGRVIRAKAEEQAKAKQIYDEKKAQGRRAALVEMERENLFTLSLGNVQPGDLIVIRLSYFQVLTRLAGELSVRVPVCPGVRYIPGVSLLRDLSGRGVMDDTDEVPDASRISPPRIDALDPQAAYFYIEGSIDSPLARFDAIASPTHPVLVKQTGEGNAVSVTLASHGAVPDRDFVLRWTETEPAELIPLAWKYRAGAASYALAQLRAPHIAEADDDYEQDVYFLVDRSGSMQGAKWTKTCEALAAFVRILGARDRVSITFFESTYRDFAEKPLSRDVLLSSDAFLGIERVGTAGGTELIPALKHVVKQVGEFSHDRTSTIILITDGQVGNENAVFDCMRGHSAVRLHAFGIDTAVNDALLKQLAAQQHGQCFLQTPDDDITGTVAKLGSMIRRPVFTDISLNDRWSLARHIVPDLHSGQIVDISALAQEDGTAMQFSGRLPGGRLHDITFEPVAVKNRAIKLLWAREKIDALLAANNSDEAIRLAKKHNILCRGVSFIAWDEEERVDVANQTLYQPSMEVVRGSWSRARAYRSVPALSKSNAFFDTIDGAPDHLSDSDDTLSLEQSVSAAAPAQEEAEYATAEYLLKTPMVMLEKNAFFSSQDGRALLDLLRLWVIRETKEKLDRCRTLLAAAALFMEQKPSGADAVDYWRKFVDANCKGSHIYPKARLLLHAIKTQV